MFSISTISLIIVALFTKPILVCALNKTIVTATCNDEVANNITYFMSPDFPELYTAKKEKTCKLQIKKVDQDVSQIRIDFIHFNLVCIITQNF